MSLKNRDKLKDLPDTPGVYIMRDETGKVIYVGKAVVLKNRVRQYFQNSEKPIKVQAMVDSVDDFDYIITRTEKDALALENNLIKKYKPYYNILLKDDKTSPYIRIDMHEEFPSITVTRKVKRDGAKYYGPFIGVSVYDVIALLQSVFKLRTCKGALKKRNRPCLNHDIDLCLAPCCGLCDAASYRAAILGAEAFLSGRNDKISGVLTQKMNAAAESENFERAIMYRNQLKLLDNLKSKVVGALGNVVDIDTFCYTDNGIYGAVSVCIVRGGKMMGVKNYFIGEPQLFGGDMTTFLPQYYSMTNELPEEICLADVIDTEPIKEYFEQTFSKRPVITFPQKGMRRKLLDTAMRNCVDFLQKSVERGKREQVMTIGACERLKEVFNLKSARRIECYDISDISGVDKVASGVVFIDGKADKTQYRRYRIKTVEGADDFRSMYETLTRRLLRYKSGDSGFNELPDLIVIDGGAEQVEFASRAADDVGVNVVMVGLAKRDEELYLRGASEPIRLSRDDYGLRLLQRVRDEAHRFAVLYHRALRSRRYESELKSINGVGTATVKKVLNAFSSQAVAQATVQELSEKANITKTAANSIYEYFHPNEESNMIKYRLIASDLDGTLLNDNLTVSDANVAAIDEFRKHGGIFTIATGRPPESCAEAIKRCKLDKYPVKMICNLGATIIDSKTLRIEKSESISSELAAELIRFVKPRCRFVQTYSGNARQLERQTPLSQIYCDSVDGRTDCVGDLVEYAKNPENVIIKIVFIVDEREVRDLIDLLTVEFPQIGFIQSTAPLLELLKAADPDLIPALIECVIKGVDKSAALKTVADYYKIPMSQVIALGDSFNDVGMIKAAGMGVAMDNAREPIKLVADYVAPDNNADGVAKTIQKFCLNAPEKGE